jgi:hypothetical protein
MKTRQIRFDKMLRHAGRRKRPSLHAGLRQLRPRFWRFIACKLPLSFNLFILTTNFYRYDPPNEL